MNASFYRKVVYGCLIVLLWFPLSFIGKPPAINEEGNREGGKLSELRDQYDLSQADLGDIDPTSESMKLATLGLRPIAINVLWTMANHYKKTEDFSAFAATVNQITLLAPNFISVWEFQAHNETYNVSVEYDHYRMRYAWVKKGIDLLIRGTQHNRRDTRLLSYLGWFFGQKIGRADEKKQFRELFSQDYDYHAKLSETMQMAMDDREILGPNLKDPDNWLVARKVQLRAVALVQSGGVPIRGKSPVLFYSESPMYRINYSKAIEEEGWVEKNKQIAGEAWRIAGVDWAEYGRRPIPTSWGYDIQLGDFEEYQRRAQDALKKLDEVAPGVREKLYQEKLAKLRADQREAWEKPEQERSDVQHVMVYELQSQMQITADEVANRAPAETRRAAKQFARQHEEADLMASNIDRYRNIVNYKYWKTRCEVEKSDEALNARESIAKAEKAFREGELEESATGEPGAKEHYENAWRDWAKVYEKYPEMMDDNEAEETIASIARYQRVLVQLDLPGLPADFPLNKLIEAQTKPGGAALEYNLRPSTAAPMEEKPAEDKPAEDKPAEEKPADEKPEDKPAEDEPAEDKPQEEKAAEQAKDE